VISFWVGGAILPILIPVAMISGLSGVGMGVFAFVIAAMVRIISLGVIIGGGIAGLAKLNTEVLRTLLEHTEHESPALELRRREAAERKLRVALQKLGLDGNP
jgi:hypothetical protein